MSDYPPTPRLDMGADYPETGEQSCAGCMGWYGTIPLPNDKCLTCLRRRIAELEQEIKWLKAEQEG